MVPQRLFDEMTVWFAGDPKRCQHFIKVHALARHIGMAEGLDEGALLVLECAALLHDIGIRPGEEKFGRNDGKIQEQEGPAPAREMLRKVGGLSEEQMQRVCYLIAHHHTYDAIDGMDFRILVEADMLVNCYEDALPAQAVRAAYDRVFRTEHGRALCRTMFGLHEQTKT